MIESHFSNIRQAILNNLNKANDNIVVAVYWFTNQQLLDKLCEKIKQGIKVELIIHNDFINNRATGLDFQKFIDIGGKLYFSNSDYPMHNKFCVIDSLILINGSYNWTYYAENKNSENILIVTNESVTLKSFKDEFHRIKQSLEQVYKVEKIQQTELNEYNGLGTKEYLANDIVYQAKDTNNPELIESAFKLSPDNMNIQKVAVDLNLTKKRQLNYSIGSSLKDDKYLIGVEKGAFLPISITKTVNTSEDNQETSSCTLHYGENPIASLNALFIGKSNNRQQSGLKIYGIPPKPQGQSQIKLVFTVSIYGILKVTKYSLDNGNTDYFYADVNKLVSDVNTSPSEP